MTSERQPSNNQSNREIEELKEQDGESSDSLPENIIEFKQRVELKRLIVRQITTRAVRRDEPVTGGIVTRDNKDNKDNKVTDVKSVSSSQTTQRIPTVADIPTVVDARPMNGTHQEQTRIRQLRQQTRNMQIDLPDRAERGRRRINRANDFENEVAM